jgi:hypothetical protein
VQECRIIADAVRDQQKKQGLLGSEEYRSRQLDKVNPCGRRHGSICEKLPCRRGPFQKQRIVHRKGYGDSIILTVGARASMHLFADSKVPLKEALARPSERLSPNELISKTGSERPWRHIAAAIQRQRLLNRNLVTRLQIGRKPMGLRVPLTVEMHHVSSKSSLTLE